MHTLFRGKAVTQPKSTQAAFSEQQTACLSEDPCAQDVSLSNTRGVYLLVERVEFQLHFIARILVQELHLAHCVVKVLLAGSHGGAARVQPKGWDLGGAANRHTRS